MFKKVIVSLVILLSTFSYSYWYNQTEIKLFYDKYYQSLVNRNIVWSDLITTLQTLNTKLTNALKTTKTKKNKEVLSYIIKINNEKISLLNTKNINNNSQTISTNTLLLWANKKTYDISKLPYKYVKLDSYLQFFDNQNYFKLNINSFFVLNDTNFNYIKNNNLTWGYFVSLPDWTNIFTNDYFLEKKYSYEDIYNLFENKIELNKKYFLDNNWNYIKYFYEKYVSFPDKYGLYLSDLKTNWISLTQTLFVNDNWQYYFVKDFTKKKLISKSFIDNITNKDEFLFDIYDDNKVISSDNELYLSQIKSFTQNIIKNATTDEQKVKKIYDWIVDNISYYDNLDDWNYKVYSWIETFKNRTGVCDWYTKLFQYMLSYAQINDVEIKRWFAFDNKEFPNFWHAWVRIWQDYYDPTFDDPIWKLDWTVYDYNYYKIPKDLIYVNRFDWFDIPTYLKNLSLSDRKMLVQKRLYELYDNYKNYNLLKKVKNKIELWYSYDETPTVSTLLDKKVVYEVNNFIFTYNNTQKQISSLNYYKLTDDNISLLMSKPDFDMKNSYLFKWYLDNWSFEYRIAYDVTFN